MLRNDILLPTCADTVRSHLVRLGVDNVGCLDVFDSVTSTNDYLQIGRASCRERV